MCRDGEGFWLVHDPPAKAQICAAMRSALGCGNEVIQTQIVQLYRHVQLSNEVKLFKRVI